MTRKQQYLFFSLTGIKLLLGLIFISRLSIDLDEPFSIFHAQQDLTAMNRLFVHENNPPLHFWMLHFWIKLFGIEPWAVRSLSLLFSILTIPVLLQIGKQIKNVEVGLWMIALFVFSNFHHSFGLEARAYALFTLLFSICILLLIKSLDQKTWKHSLFFGVALAFLFYTHYMALIAIPVLLGVFFIFNIRSQFNLNLIHTVVVLGVFTIGISPMLGPFFSRLQHVSQAGTWVPKPQWTELYGLINKFMNGPGFLAIFGLVLLYLGYSKKGEFKKTLRQIRHEKIGAIVLLTFAIYFGAFLLSLFAASSVFLDRYLFFVSIGLFAMLAWLVENWKPIAGKSIFVLIAAVVFGFNPLKTHNRASDDLASYAAQFQGTYIITPPFYDLTFLYHFNREAFSLQLEGAALNPLHIYPIYNLDELNFDELRQPIVLIDAASHFTFGEQKLKNDMLLRFALKASKTFPGDYEVLVFEK